MEHVNQKVCVGRLSRLPQLIIFVLATSIIGIGLYAIFAHGAPQSHSAQSDSETPSLQAVRQTIERLSNENSYLTRAPYVNQVEPPQELEPAPRPTNEDFATDYARYQQVTKSPASTPAQPSARELAQAQLRERRAAALLQALAATTSTKANLSNNSSPANSAARTGAATSSGLTRSGSTSNAGYGNASMSGTSYGNGGYGNGGMSGVADIAGAGGVGGTNSGGSGYLQAYQALENSDFHLNTQVETVLSPYLIRQGAIIPCVLLSGINSDLPGQVQAQVSEDVWDSPRGQHLLIPRGSKVIGQYASSPSLGQERLMLAFNRVIFPDGKALALGAMPGASTDGYSGLDADVNNHFWRLMSNAVLLGGITAGISLSTDSNQRDSEGNLSVGGALSQGLGQSLGRVLTNTIERHMAISPTLTVEPGLNFNVVLTKDIYFNGPYTAFDYELLGDY